MARIQGITIELGADASGIEQALKDVNKASRTASKELGQINRALQFDPDNVNLLSQKFDVLQDSIRNTETKLSALREAQAEVNRQFEAGEIDASAYRAFQREIEQTEGRLRAFRQQAEDVQARINVQGDTTGIEKMKAALKELGPAAKQAASEIGSALSTAGAAGTAAVTGLVVGMSETNKDLAMLETQIGQVGLALEDIGNARTMFDSVGQETDQVTEAMGNLIQAGYQTRDSIEEISASLAGAVVKYGDTFNVEGLAESITTTTQLGEVTGQLTDLLEKEGINIDNFNAKMQSMSTEQERANYISQLLADQGLTSLYNKYAEGNAEIVDASAAQLSMTDALSELSVALTPLVTMVSEFVTKVVDWANENQGLATALAIAMGAITALSGAFAMLSPIVSALIALWPALVAAFGAISAPIAIAVAAITGIVAALVTAYAKVEWFRDGVNKIWDIIKDYTSQAFNAVKKLVVDLIGSTAETGKKILDDFKKFWDENGKAITNFVKTHFNKVKSDIQSIMKAIETVFQTVWPIISGVVKTAWGIIQTTVSTAVKLVLGVIQTTMKALQGDWKGAWETIKSTADGIMKNIVSAFKNIDLLQVGKDIIGGLIKGIGSMASTVIDKAKNLANSVKDTIANALKIKSPSRIMIGFGENIGEGLVIGMDDMVRDIAQTSQRLSNAASGALGSLASSSVKSQNNQVVQQQITNNSSVKLTGLIQAISELAQRPVQTSVNMDGRVIATAVSGHQYNTATLNALSKGVSL